jgi:hypothetical protein
MYLLKDLDTVDLKYSSFEYAFLILQSLIALVGVTGITIVLVATLTKKNNPASTYLLLSQSAGDFLICIMQFFGGVINVSQGKWAIGTAGCLISGVLLFASCAISVLSLLAVSVERYMAVIHLHQLSSRSVAMIVAGIWVFSCLLFALFPFYTQSYATFVALQPSKYYCSSSWWLPTRENTVFLVLTVIILGSVIVVMAFCYFFVVSKVIEIRKKLSTTSSVDAKSSPDSAAQVLVRRATKNSKIDPKEKMLIKKAIAITGVFCSNDN